MPRQSGSLALALLPLPGFELGLSVVVLLLGVLVLAVVRRRRSSTALGDGPRGEPVPPPQPPGAQEILIPEPRQPVPLGRRLLMKEGGDPWSRPVVLALLGVLLATAGFALRPLLWQRPPEPRWAAAPVAMAPPGHGIAPMAPSPALDGLPSVVDPSTGERLILWQGGDQVGAPERRLAAPLSVILQDSAGGPVSGREVRFDVRPRGGRMTPPRVRTSESGLAVAGWWLGTDPDSLVVAISVDDRPALRLEVTAAFDTAPPVPLADAADLEQTTSATPSSPTPAGTPESDPDRGAASADAAGAPTATPPEAAETPADDALGVPVGSSPPAAPVVRPRAAARWSAGGVNTCRIDDAGALSCWGGRGSAGGAGVVTRELRTRLRTVRVGVFDACGLAREGSRVLCWRVAGTSGGEPTLRETELPDGARPVDVVVGSEHVCALASSGAVYCWGGNARGQLGNGTTRDAPAPVRVRGVADAVRLTAGWLHTCALTATGDAYCWGANGHGQLGDGTTSDRSRATRVRQSVAFASLTAGSGHTCGLTPGGTAWCWGDNSYGQVGTTAGRRVVRPTLVETEPWFTSLSAGGVHTCALTAGGDAWCWGRNTFGQLGTATADPSSAPALVAGGHVFRTLEAGGAHTCGEVADEGLYCWGNNLQGQLGDGTRENRFEPVRSHQP